MLGRNIKADKDGNEWMNAAQYTRALEEDFDIKLTSTLVSNYRRQNKFNTIHLNKISGKNCINYTQTAIQFLSSHPAICPSDFADKAKAWKKKLKPAARKTVSTKIKTPPKKPEEPADNYEAQESIVIEKAKHEKLKREKLQFEMDVMKGKYIHEDDLLPALQTIMIEIRQAVKALIPRVAPIAAAMNDIHEIRTMLDDETNVALDHLERIPDIMGGTYQQQMEEQQRKQVEDET